MRLNLVLLMARTDFLRHWRRCSRHLFYLGLFMLLVSGGVLLFETRARAATEGAVGAAKNALAEGRVVPGRVVLVGADSAVVRALKTCAVERRVGATGSPGAGEVWLRLPVGFDAALVRAAAPRVICEYRRDDAVARELCRELRRGLAHERLARVVGDSGRGEVIAEAARAPFAYEFRYVQGGDAAPTRVLLAGPCFFVFMALISAVTAILVRERFGNGMRHLLLTGVSPVEVLAGKLLALVWVTAFSLFSSGGGLLVLLGFVGVLGVFSDGVSPGGLVGLASLGALGLVNFLLLVAAVTFSARDADRAAMWTSLLSYIPLTGGMISLTVPTSEFRSYVALPVPLLSAYITGTDWLARLVSDRVMATAILVQLALGVVLFRWAKRAVGHEARALGFATGPFRRATACGRV